MDPYVILAIGFGLGVFATLLVLGLLEVAHRGGVEYNAMEAYYQGVRDGLAGREIDLTDPEEKL